MIDHPILQGIQAHMYRNLPEYLTFLGALAIAGVCTMPKKAPLLREDHPLQEVWSWVRDALQTATPAARSHQQPPNPTQQKETK